MNSLPILALLTVSTLFGFVWHNQPARAESSFCDEDSISSKLMHVDWVMVVIWSFVFLSFAALLLAGCIVWMKCHGDFPH